MGQYSVVASRIRAVVDRALLLVAFAVAIGLLIAAVAAAVAAVMGDRGRTLVVVAVIAVAAAGALAAFAGVFTDPMGMFTAFTLRGAGGPGWWFRHKDDATYRSIERMDDVLYASGVVLIALALLIGYLCDLAGVPPKSPFR